MQGHCEVKLSHQGFGDCLRELNLISQNS